MNRYPIWKYLIILAIIIPGIFYALPNIYGDDPGLQIRSLRSSNVTLVMMQEIESELKAENLQVKSISKQSNQELEIRFVNTDDQLKAQEVLRSYFNKNEISREFSMALNLLPSTPVWLRSLGGKPMNLGLDLRGGVHFLMEVDVDGAVKATSEGLVVDIKRILREDKIRYKHVKLAAGNKISVQIRNAENVDKAIELIEAELPELFLPDYPDGGEDKFVFHVSEEEIAQAAEFALDQNMSTLRNRINELGVAEPLVQRQGNNRIVVELPGVQDSAKARDILGKTATLEIKLVDEQNDGRVSRAPAGSRLYPLRSYPGQQILLKDNLVYSGQNIIDSQPGFDSQSGSPIVTITLDSKGASINSRVTADNVNKRMAVIYKETITTDKLNENGEIILDDEGNPEKNVEYIEEVITAPVIRSQLGKRFQIEGLDGPNEARDLSLLLRAGAFAAPIQIVEERTVGPSLGLQNIKQGVQSVLIGLALVFVFMFFYYRKFGVIANVALILNLVLIIAVLSMLQATLTLPGVAGMVLTVGMAVDANVLIFERIREELRNNVGVQMSISRGYEQAFSTIFDANITTLIAAIVLFIFGTGPIKGFATTLSIGIATSMFTAIFVTRGIVNLWFGRKRLKELSI